MLIMERKRYNCWDALGDIGGFNDGLVLLLKLFMARYSSAMFDHSIVQGSRYRKSQSGEKETQRKELVKKLRVMQTPFQVNDRESTKVFSQTLDGIKKIKTNVFKCTLKLLFCLNNKEEKRSFKRALDKYSD